MKYKTRNCLPNDYWLLINLNSNEENNLIFFTQESQNIFLV
ncbi:protein of unknown function [Chryseobacterium sp. JV274]|nr:protein of unknown function [Chryseobacterium sp. JV274]